jgi:steroid delta-isomerase-like uncharacterized protein
LSDLFDPDGEYDDVAFAVVSRGPGGARGWAEGFLAAFPDLVVDVVAEFATDGDEVVEWLMSGTHRGQFDGLSPSGRRFQVRGVTVLRTRGGRIVRCSDYWDLGTVRRQLERPDVGPLG